MPKTYDPQSEQRLSRMYHALTANSSAMVAELLGYGIDKFPDHPRQIAACERLRRRVLRKLGALPARQSTPQSKAA